MLTQVISGGQIGADRAALKAAQAVGFKTGGWMPKCFRARDGMKYQLKALYGMKEHPSHEYAPRTEFNVKGSDATLRIAHNFSSAGERCTLKYINKYAKLYTDIPIREDGTYLSTHPRKIARWIVSNNISILNVAGNADYAIEAGIEEMLIKAFQLVKDLQEGREELE